MSALPAVKMCIYFYLWPTMAFGLVGGPVCRLAIVGRRKINKRDGLVFYFDWPVTDW